MSGGLFAGGQNFGANQQQANHAPQQQANPAQQLVNDEPQGDVLFCTNCGNKLAPDAMLCSKCGNKVQQELKCSNCGRSLEPDDMFCSGCGQPTNE